MASQDGCVRDADAFLVLLQGELNKGILHFA